MLATRRFHLRIIYRDTNDLRFNMELTFSRKFDCVLVCKNWIRFLRDMYILINSILSIYMEIESSSEISKERLTYRYAHSKLLQNILSHTIIKNSKEMYFVSGPD